MAHQFQVFLGVVLGIDADGLGSRITWKKCQAASCSQAEHYVTDPGGPVNEVPTNYNYLRFDRPFSTP